MKIDISSLTYDKLNSELGLLGLPKFRTSQIYSWLHKYGCASFDEMTNISKTFVKSLVKSIIFHLAELKINMYQN